MERANQITFTPDFGGEPAVQHAQPLATWLAARGDFDDAWANLKAATAAATAARKALEAEAPVPEALRDKRGGFHLTEWEIKAASDLTFDQKASALEVLAQYQPQRQAAKVRVRFDELTDAETLAEEAFFAAASALQATPAPSGAALVTQVRAMLALSAEACGETFADAENPEHMSELLTRSGADTGRLLATIYQQAARLAGVDNPGVRAEPFDVEAWIAAFEAHPGHVIRQGGIVEYNEPKCFGEDTPSHDDLRIADPAAIARYEAAVRARFTDEQWAEREADRARAGGSRTDGQPFIASDPQHIAQAYPDGGPEYERLMGLYRLRRERLDRTSPTGAHLWRNLTDWQRHAVRDYVRAQNEMFPNLWRWKGDEWIDAFETAGGSLHSWAEGPAYGMPVPAPFHAARLVRILESDEDLKREVKAIVQARSAAEVRHAAE